ncbi:hypothetical protein [Glycomyces sp. NPDC048151]|uniref:hypothetical protein n=1 Tax=Glycomyces sp. NPDC048151 TaxID=3364002 RepID=UPI003716FA0C
MPFTTPDRSYDLAAMWPELATLARTAVRLHPRCGKPTAEQSSIGGPLLWPIVDPWPTCSGPHEWVSLARIDEVVEYRRIMELAWSRTGVGSADRFTAEERAFLDRLDEHERSNPWRVEFRTKEASLIPVAQLFTRDVPGLPFSNRFDLLQVLWCPYNHPETEAYWPATQLRWRDTNQSTLRPFYPPKDTLIGCADYVPNPCVLAPEEVTEYPDMDLLSPDLRENIKATANRMESFYYSDHALAPGWKANGHGTSWSLFNAFAVRCECGAEAKPLLNAATGEWDPSTSHWMPIEDLDHADAEKLKNGFDPVEIVIGRGYDLQIFHCGLDPEHPPVSVMV